MAVGPYEGDPKKVTRLRPGHADLAGTMKYDFDDVRNILERASARETAARVAVGAVCRRFLEEFGVAIHSHTTSIGDVWAEIDGEPNWAATEESAVRSADGAATERMVRAIDAAKEAGDTLGGTFEMWATGVPIGLGSHVQWDRKLDGHLAQAVMSIQAVKGVEIGGGFAVAAGPGSEAHDVIMTPEHWNGRPWRRETNRAGGLEGGMTNGEPVVVRGALKPISTLSKPLPSVDLHTGEQIQAHYERSDVCTVPAAGVVGEAMVAIVLARAFLEKFGGDSLAETRRNFEAYQATIGPRGSTR
jgi:chorismate synthase